MHIGHMSRGGYHQGLTEYVEQLEHKIARHRSIIDIQEADLTRTTQNYTSTLNANNELREACHHLQHERDELNRKLVEVTDLSNLRGNELAGAQAFLAKTDAISGQEVQDLVHTLNEEIFQAAASLGDCVVRRSYDLSIEDRENYYDRVGGAVGQKILSILSQQSKSDDHEINPLLVQIVVQIFLVTFCAQEINSWDPNNVDFSDGLQKVYEGLQASQQQSVCGRWRALTLTQIRTDFEPWAKHLTKNFKRLLAVACWEISNPDHFTTFNRHLESIFKAASQVRRAIGQDLVEDYKVYLVSNFRFTDSYMEEAYGDEGSDRKKSRHQKGPRMVIGTTALGLNRLAVSLTDKSTRDPECVLPPKVVVETSIDAILALHDRTRSSSKSASSRSRYHDQDGRDY